MKSSLNQYFEEILLSPITKLAKEKHKIECQLVRRKSNKITLSQYFEKELLEETTAAERTQEIIDNNNKDKDEEDFYTSYASYMSSSNPGSDNLLVTFDYGSHDSLDGDHLSLNSQQHELTANNDDNDKLNKQLFKIPEEESFEDLLAAKNNASHSTSSNIFKVHQIQHDKSDSNNNTRTNSCISMTTSLVEYNIDTSGDYGSWAQSESEQEELDSNVKTYSNYRYEDLIKNEVLIYDGDDDDDGNDIKSSNEERQALINFNFNQDIPPLWFNNSEQLYYRSVDYLN